MQTFEQFAKKHRVELTYIKRANRTDSVTAWDKGASHYNCTLHHEDGSMTFWYSMGSAHKTGPKVGDVLQSLALDASSAEESFEDWCANCGYDTDSRKAFATYEACVATHRELQRLLGARLAGELLYQTSEDGE